MVGSNQLKALLVTAPAAGLLAIGTDHAGQLLITAGQHPERLRGEAAALVADFEALHAT
jgi:hypothetical protein